jgi:hypothetical protein
MQGDDKLSNLVSGKREHTREAIKWGRKIPDSVLLLVRMVLA